VGSSDAVLPPPSGDLKGRLDAENDQEDISLLDTLAEAERLYLDRQIVSAAMRFRDADLFSRQEQDSDGFVRLMLRESYHDFVLPGSDEKHNVVFEPRLMLHNSGVVQIELAIRADTPLGVRQVLAMMWGPEPVFVHSEMSAPLLRGTPWEVLADFSQGNLDANMPLGVIKHSKPVSMSDLLEMHLLSVLAIMKRSYSDWMVYPVAIVTPDACCPRDRWRAVHHDDLFRLTSRMSFDQSIAPHAEVPKDLSLDGDHSLFAALGSAIYLQWKGPAPEGIAELDTVMILEYALLVYMRLHSMEKSVSRMATGERRLRTQYRAAIRLFSELRGGCLRAGEAREILSHVLHDLGAPEIRKTIETSLDLAAEAYATLSAERASRRAWLITLAATLIAGLVAYRPLQDLLDSVSTVQFEPNWVQNLLRWFASQGFWGPGLMLAAVALLIFVLWLADTVWRRLPRRIPSFRRGYKWPTEFRRMGNGHSPAATNQHTDTLRADLSG